MMKALNDLCIKISLCSRMSLGASMPYSNSIEVVIAPSSASLCSAGRDKSFKLDVD